MNCTNVTTNSHTTVKWTELYLTENNLYSNVSYNVQINT